MSEDNDVSRVKHFMQSMVIDYEKWHDGVGYDIALIREATPTERTVIETLLLGRGVRDWRDVEALAEFTSPAAEAALREAHRSDDAEIRLAVSRYAPHVLAAEDHTASLVHALKTTTLMDGLSQALDAAATFHPPEVIDALFQGVMHREGDVAVHFAALLLFIHGKADAPFDWAKRPFFLRFNTSDVAARTAAYCELCDMINGDKQD